MTDPARMPLLAHLEELRNRLIIGSVAIAVGSIVAYVFNGRIFDLVVGPYEAVTGNVGLSVFEVGEAFSVTMKLSLFGGIVLASPILIYQVWAFVAPALTKREKRWVVPLSLALAVLFAGGIVFAYWSMERALSWLLGFGGDRLTPVIGVSRYLDFALRFLLVFGLAFEFPVFLFAAAAAGMVGSRRLMRGRRWAVLIIVILGAALTPSGDPLTLLLLSIPLYVLYEATIWLVRFVLKK